MSGPGPNVIKPFTVVIYIFYKLECLSPTSREYYWGKYHYTVELLFYWFGLVCFANKNKNCQSSYSWFQTSQTEDQLYNDTSPFSIPCRQAFPAYSYKRPSLVRKFINYGRQKFYNSGPGPNVIKHFTSVIY